MRHIPSGFCFLDFATIFLSQSKVVSLVSDPQPAGSCPCIYIPQEQAASTIPPGAGFPFRRLLRLAGDTVEVFDHASTLECFFNIHLDMILPSTPTFSLRFSQRNLHAACPAISFLFQHCKNIWRGARIMQLFAVKIFSRFLLPLPSLQHQ
jgi:hypothetical protein